MIRNVSIHDIRNFLKEINKKARNPKYKDIKKIIRIFGITLNILDDAEKEFYSNFIEKRDRIAHNPRESILFSFRDFEKVVKIGEKILNYISRSLFEKIIEHIKGEFS